MNPILKTLNANLPYTFQATLHEKHDEAQAARLLLSKKLLPEAHGNLEKYVKSSTNGMLTVEYTESPERIGRLLSKAKRTTKKQFIPHYAMGLDRGTRNYLTKRMYRDIDMQNCAPSLFAQILEALGEDCPLLQEYVSKPQAVRELLAKECQVTTKVAKELLVRILFGGSVDAWCNDHHVNPTLVPDAIHALQDQVKRGMKALLVNFPKYKSHQEKVKPDAPKPFAVAAAFCLQDAEKKCLVAMYKAMTKRNITVGALIHDGMMIELDDDPTQLMRDVEADVFASTGFRVTLVEKVEDLDTTLVDPSLFFANNDDEASNVFLEVFQDSIIKTPGRIFVFDDGLWKTSASRVSMHMLQKCMTLDIQNESGHSISKEAPSASRIIKVAEAKLAENHEFENDLYRSNLFKLVFKDGYYDFSTGKFCKGFDGVKSTIRINRSFPTERNEDVIAEVYRRVLNPILPDETMRTHFLQYIARGLAGHVEDKAWAVCLGERNCGKGMLNALFEGAFGAYVGSINSENFMFKTNQGDAAKDQSWFLDCQYKRLVFSNEITMDSRVKLNGNLFKRFASGGDKLIARKNFQDEVEFEIQSRMIIMANDLPRVSPQDATETMTQFDFPSVFVPPDRMTENCLDCFRLADPDLKRWIKSTPKVWDATLHIILDHYRQTIPQVPESMTEAESITEEYSFDTRLREHFEITNSPDDWVLKTDVNQVMRDDGMSSIKVGREMKKRAIVHAMKRVERQGRNVPARVYIGIKCISSY
jgi:hypothetical protein